MVSVSMAKRVFTTRFEMFGFKKKKITDFFCLKQVQAVGRSENVQICSHGIFSEESLFKEAIIKPSTLDPCK